MRCFWYKPLVHKPHWADISLQNNELLEGLVKFSKQRILNCDWIWQKDFMDAYEVISELCIWINDTPIDDYTVDKLRKRCMLIIQNEWMAFLKKYHPTSYANTLEYRRQWRRENKHRIKRYKKKPKNAELNRKYVRKYWQENSETVKKWNKEQAQKRKENLTDTYIKILLVQKGIKRPDITQEMIDRKRQEVIAYRQKNNHHNV